MDDAVDGGGDHIVVAEHRSPAGEFVVCGDDQASFISGKGKPLTPSVYMGLRGSNGCG